MKLNSTLKSSYLRVSGPLYSLILCGYKILPETMNQASEYVFSKTTFISFFNRLTQYWGSYMPKCFIVTHSTTIESMKVTPG